MTRRTRPGLALLGLGMLALSSAGARTAPPPAPPPDELDWYWGRACASETDFHADRAACVDQTGIAGGRIDPFSALAFRDCLVERGWRKVARGRSLACPPEAGEHRPPLEKDPGVTFDACFRGCREAAGRSHQACFDVCRAR